ncbi:lipopolysaccharide heptosyltransferase II [Kaarinaea lacus]
MSQQMSEPGHRILIVGPSWVGDMVMAQSLYKTLKQQHPDIIIDVLAPAWSEPIIKRMPEVRKSVIQVAGHGQLGLRSRYHIGKQLRSERYQHAIVLPRSYKAALIPFFAKIPVRTGYRGEMRYGVINDVRALDKKLLTQTVQRFVALGVPPESTLPPPIPQPQLQIDAGNRERLLSRLKLRDDSAIVALLPGAEYGPAKRWPIGYYAQLASALLEKGCQVWILGSEKDKLVGEQIVQASSAAVANLCGKTSLEEVVDLLTVPQLVVTNDSGLMHIAAAVNQKVVALYGSSTPDYTPPLTDKATVFYERLACSPCFKRECPLGHMHCLTNISVEKVLDAALKNLD